MKRIDLSGQQFNNWTVLEHMSGKGYKCRCKCGTVKIVQRGNLTTGASRSCRQCSEFAVEIHNKLPEGEAGCNAVIASYKQSAKARGYSWQLSREESKILFSGDCVYCGIEPRQIHRRENMLNGQFIYNGIDRIDNSLGYIFSNCVSCCKTCNYMKRGSSFEEFKAHIYRIVEHLEVL
jgi:hypothetical protein